MKSSTLIYSAILWGVFQIIPIDAASSIQGTSKINLYNYDNESYNEFWLDISAMLSSEINIGLNYESHESAPIYYKKLNDNTVFQYYLNYSKDTYQITLGTFYEYLGEGLVLNAFENKSLRFHSDLYGILYTQENSKFIWKALYAYPGINPSDYDPLYAMEARWNVLDNISIGSTYAQSKLNRIGNKQWGSILSNVMLDNLDLYIEYASYINESSQSNKQALYYRSIFNLNQAVILFEGKDYQNFIIQNTDSKGMSWDYNNPPTTQITPKYSLQSKYIYDYKQSYENGYLCDISVPFGDFSVVEIAYSTTKKRNNKLLFDEWYAEVGKIPFKSSETTIAFGKQMTPDKIIHHVILDQSWTTLFPKPLNTILEYQIIKRGMTNYKNQVIVLDLKINDPINITYFNEHTTDPLSDEKTWHSGRITYAIGNELELIGFYGSRPEGKLCAGGICTKLPAFDGVELSVQYRF